jgi:arylsulfatase A-like enzyme
MAAQFVSTTLLAQQPNIVIINIDDMGWGDFNVYGSAYSQTPNIDQLSAQGTRFTQFYSGAPICSPSRAALMTGKPALKPQLIRRWREWAGSARDPQG